MVLGKDSERKQFSSTLRKELYEEMQEYSKKTGMPISKIFDKAIEDFLGKGTFKVSNDLYNFLVVLFGTTGKDIDQEVEKILRKYIEDKKQQARDILGWDK
jgi:metal-responsive CopG/Arc/MetJ family transcriptional regulator